MGLLSGLLGNASVMDNNEVQKQFEKIFIQNEKVEAGFKIIRDVFIFRICSKKCKTTDSSNVG